MVTFPLTSRVLARSHLPRVDSVSRHDANRVQLYPSGVREVALLWAQANGPPTDNSALEDDLPTYPVTQVLSTALTLKVAFKFGRKIVKSLTVGSPAASAINPAGFAVGYFCADLFTGTVHGIMDEGLVTRFRPLGMFENTFMRHHYDSREEGDNRNFFRLTALSGIGLAGISSLLSAIPINRRSTANLAQVSSLGFIIGGMLFSLSHAIGHRYLGTGDQAPILYRSTKSKLILDGDSHELRHHLEFDGGYGALNGRSDAVSEAILEKLRHWKFSNYGKLPHSWILSPWLISAEAIELIDSSPRSWTYEPLATLASIDPAGGPYAALVEKVFALRRGELSASEADALKSRVRQILQYRATSVISSDDPASEALAVDEIERRLQRSFG